MDELSPSNLRVGCSVDLMSMTSWQIRDANANISILSLHNALAYGFELSWFYVYCDKCRLSQYCEGGAAALMLRCLSSDFLYIRRRDPMMERRSPNASRRFLPCKRRNPRVERRDANAL
ncbi:hypothetical protein RND71_002163 [Anisodus tanguticus]|uniref:Uncharacterized protein n=1 Tax=Anisodus tanguticus TaxID=243964 RepID=A0AAE1T3H9_9SOLA|nr:hypothetical protein RND71_002163 [Anisodus tanguticus]